MRWKIAFSTGRAACSSVEVHVLSMIGMLDANTVISLSLIAATCCGVRLLNRHPASSTAIRKGRPFSFRQFVASWARESSSPDPISSQRLHDG